MTYEKTWRKAVSNAEVDKAIERAARALKGSSKRITQHTVAERASIYVNVGKGSILERIKEMDERTQTALGIQPERLGTPLVKKRAIRFGRWNR